MIRGKPPAITMLQSTTFLRKVADALPLFCTKNDKRGEKAIKEKFKDSYTHMLHVCVSWHLSF